MGRHAANARFRDWALARGLRVRKMPEAMQGETAEGPDVYGVPLAYRRGWLWDAGPNVGIDVRAGPRVARPMLAALLATGAVRVQVVADDGFVAWVRPEEWARGHQAALKPLKRRVSARPS